MSSGKRPPFLVLSGEESMSSRFQAFGASVAGGLQEEGGKLSRGVLVVGVVFLIGALVAIVAACLSLL